MKRFFRILLASLLALLVIFSIGWYLFVYDRDFTRDVLLQQARYHDLKGNTKTSAWFYNMAYSHTGQDGNVAIELANQYKSAGNYTKAEVTLTHAIQDEANADLYTALCKIYVEQDKLLDAVFLLSNISDPAIRAELDSRRPTAPTADHESGLYSEYISVTLSSSEGKIYYTTDGEYPSIQNAPFSEPIPLELGETKIMSISVADSGLVSPLSALGYTVGGVIEPAFFLDPAMEAAVRTKLDMDSSKTLYTSDLWKITEFEVPADVTLLEDLAMMSGLNRLTIHERKLDSLDVLSSLVNLQYLDLTGCRFSPDSLSVLSGLPKLTNLNLAECGLSTIAALEGTNALTVLDLSHNTVRNLAPLSGMTGMTELYLQHNALTSLEALNTLANLNKLDVSYNSLFSIDTIPNCTRLNWLNAGNNQITDASGAVALASLTHLNLNYNQLTDISSLGGCVGLTNLNISNNHIEDLSALSTLTNLTSIDFSYNMVSSLPDWPSSTPLQMVDGSYNQVTNIDLLKDMQDITYIYMDYNQITNVDALASCYRLIQLNVFGNDIDSVSALTSHDIIVNFDPT